jgi:hypothetical protein
MLKKGDDNHDEVDDRSRNHYALTELRDSNAECLGIFLQDSVFTALLSYQQRSVGEQETNGQCNTYIRSQLGFQLPARPPYI